MNTGIVRCVDELGRIVLPVELRRTLNMPQGTPIEIFTDGTKIILQKHEQACFFCGKTGKRARLQEFLGKQICQNCVDSLRKELG